MHIVFLLGCGGIKSTSVMDSFIDEMKNIQYQDLIST